MKITNYKEQEEAEKYLARLEGQMKELNDKMWPLQLDINETEQALKDYREEQSALDE